MQELDQKQARFFQGFGHSSGHSLVLPTPISSEACRCRYLPT